MELHDAKALLVGAKIRFNDNREMLEAIDVGIRAIDKQISRKPIIEK